MIDVMIIIALFLTIQPFSFFSMIFKERSRIQKLEAMGYIIRKEKQIREVENEQMHISIDYTKKTAIINLKYKKLELPNFKIKKRGFFERMLDEDNGDVKHLHRAYKVLTKHPIEILQYLSARQPKFFEFLNKNYSWLNSMGNEVHIGFKMPKSQCHSQFFLNMLPEFMKFKELLQPHPNEYKFLKIKSVEFKSFTCYNCKSLISFSDTICNNCKTKVPVCIICRQDPNMEDGISLLSCCKSYCHTSHLDIWIEGQGTCPYCTVVNPLVVDIVDSLT